VWLVKGKNGFGRTQAEAEEFCGVANQYLL
jgi:hypothetical protein